MAKKLDGKVAIITGAGSGIGRATALLFAQEGAKVIVADIVDKQGKEAAEAIKKNGGEAVFIHTDVSKTEDVKNVIKEAVTRYGRLNIMYNNAGIEGQMKDTANYPEDIFDRIISVNLKGVWLGIKYAIPEMLKGGGGSIISTASVAGLVGFPGLVGYCASKGGVIQITKTAALEYAKQNIRINCIAPGVIATPMVERLVQSVPGMQEGLTAAEPVGRTGKPEEIAKAALYLASDDSTFVTGTTLVVDGGFVAQ